MGATIWAVVKDPGGVAALLPVVEELQREGLEVLLIANGKAIEVLSHRNIPHVTADRASDVTSRYKLPRVLLTSMCSGGGIGLELMNILRVCTIAFQDVWGMNLSDAWGHPDMRPDYVFTNDEMGKTLIRKAWPDFNADRILTPGFAMLDRFASVDVGAENNSLRKKLGLDPELPIFFFAGQGEGTSSALKLVVASLNELGGDFYFIPKPHPRTEVDFREEIGGWQKELASFRGRLIVDWFQACTSEQIVAGCVNRGAVLSMYSTVLTEGAVLRANAVSVMPPEAKSALWIANPATGSLPLAELGCVASAEDQTTLTTLLRRATEGKLGLEKEQKKYIHADGHNAKRCANQVKEILKTAPP